MSPFLKEQIGALGAAPVFVILKDRTKAPPKSLIAHFQAIPEKSHMLAAARSERPAGPETESLVPAGVVPMARHYPNLGILYGTVCEAGLAALDGSAAVSTIESAPVMSLIRPVAESSARPRAKISWGIRAMRANRLWKQGLTGKGVLVGHLDTGVDATHPALEGAVRHFGVASLQSGQVTEPPVRWDTGTHGTHTAGTICAREVRVGNKYVSFGVAPGAELASATVIEGGEVTERIIAGMDWAAGKGVRILNMSLGLRGYWPNFEPIMAILRQLDILPIVASGNEGPDTSRSPGNYHEVLSVGAVDRHGEVGSFSSSQTFARVNDPIVPDLVGPGMDIESCFPGGGYASLQGTSMAAPHIAGLAALLMEAKPGAGAAEIERAIESSCQPLGDRLRTNRGMPDAVAALGLL